MDSRRPDLYDDPGPTSLLEPSDSEYATTDASGSTPASFREDIELNPLRSGLQLTNSDSISLPSSPSASSSSSSSLISKVVMLVLPFAVVVLATLLIVHTAHIYPLQNKVYQYHSMLTSTNQQLVARNSHSATEEAAIIAKLQELQARVTELEQLQTKLSKQQVSCSASTSTRSSPSPSLLPSSPPSSSSSSSSPSSPIFLASSPEAPFPGVPIEQLALHNLYPFLPSHALAEVANASSSSPSSSSSSSSASSPALEWMPSESSTTFTQAKEWKRLWGGYARKFNPRAAVFSPHWNIGEAEKPFVRYIPCESTTTPPSPSSSSSSSSPSPLNHISMALITLLPGTLTGSQLETKLLELAQDWVPNLLHSNPMPFIVFIQGVRSVPPRSAIDWPAIIKRLAALYPTLGLSFDIVSTDESVEQGRMKPIVRMNYFLGMGVYAHPRLAQADYVVRLDSDVSILAKYESALRPQLVHVRTDSGLTVSGASAASSTSVAPVASSTSVASAAHSSAGSGGALHTIIEADVDVAYAVLGMPEVGIHLNEPLYRAAFGWFLQQGVMLDASVEEALYGPFGLHDTLFAGPFEIHRRGLFNSSLYHAYFAAVAEPFLKQNLPEATTVREQFIKSLFVRAMVPPGRRRWMCDMALKHKIDFPARCVAKCLPSVLSSSSPSSSSSLSKSTSNPSASTTSTDSSALPP